MAVEQTMSLDVSLTVGAVATTMEVVANAVQLASATSSITTVIGSKGLQELPLNNRNPFMLTLLTPGVVPTSPCYPDRGGCRSSGPNLWSGAAPFIGGGRSASSDITVDGTSIMIAAQDPSNLAPVYSPAPESVEEFAVLSNALPAEYGRTGGGVTSFATRSGVNRLHGSAFEFLRNYRLDANDFFANRNGVPLAVSRRNQFGGSIGGPVYIPKVYNGHNRTFFFFDEQSTRNPQGSLFSTTVPTADWVQGNFSNLRNSSGQPITVYDPSTGALNSSGAWIRQPFPGNVVPGNRVDSVAANARTYFPLPNATPANPYTQTNNYVTNRIISTGDDRVDVRLDHNFSERLRVFGRGSYLHYLVAPTNIWKNVATPWDDGNRESHNYDGALNAIYTISPTTVLNINFGAGTYLDRRLPFSEGFDFTQLGFPSSLAAEATKRSLEFPGIAIAGLTSASAGGNSLGAPGGTWLKYHPIMYVGRSDLTKIMGNHTVKVGVEFRKFFLDQLQAGNASGAYAFDAGWTQQNPSVANSTQGNGMASFLLGTMSSGNMAHLSDAAIWSKYLALYVQDDWRVSTNLTFNVGLRWDVDFPRTENANRLSYFDLNAPSPIAGKVPGFPNLAGAMNFVTPQNRQQTPTDLHNFGPRFGFAYKAGSKTVLRAAYALMYAASPMQPVAAANAGMEGFSSTSTVVPTLDSGRTVAAYLSNPFPGGLNLPLGAAQGPNSGAATDLGLAVTTSFFSDHVSAAIQQWNFNIQRELGQGFLIETGYRGQKGNHLVDAEGSQTYDQLPGSYAAMGNALNAQVPNPFYGVITNSTSILSKPTVVASQLLRPYPQYTGINATQKPAANSNYHAFTLRLEKRFSGGFGLLTSFTAQKLIDDSSAAATWIGTIGNKQDFYNRRLEKSISTMDVSRRLVISLNYDLPMGKNRKFLAKVPTAVDLILGGWQTNAILSEQAGTPIVVTQNQNTTSLGSSGQRPDYTKNPTLSGAAADRLNQWFDTSAFSFAHPFAFGNVPRSLPSTRSYGTHTLDFSLFKNFRYREALSAQLRAEAFNLTNTPQFSWPASQLGGAGFGVVSSIAGAPRQVQVALKVTF
jgi:hypothetical protein